MRISNNNIKIYNKLYRNKTRAVGRWDNIGISIRIVQMFNSPRGPGLCCRRGDARSCVSLRNRVVARFVNGISGRPMSFRNATLAVPSLCEQGFTVLGLCVYDYSRTGYEAAYEAAYERYQQLQCYKGMKTNVAILLKRLRSRDMA